MNPYQKFKSNASEVAGSLNLKFNFKNLGYLPRWVILIIDISIVILTGLLTYLLLRGMKLIFIPYDFLAEALGVYFVVNIFFFWVFRTYSGIIRHSSYIDGVKLFFTQLCALITLVFVNFVFLLDHDFKLYLNTGLFLNTVLSFFFLFFYRIVVKQTFERYFNVSKEAEVTPILIYGFNNNAIAVANALRAESPARFKLLGFIEKSKQNASKRILDLPIIPLKHRVPVMMRSVGARAVIIADKSLTKQERMAIVEDCLEFNYKVFTVSLVTDWENQEDIARNIKTFEIQDLLERKPIVLDMKAISAQLQNKTIMVTGAAGSIGSEIVRQVINFNPRQIIILDQAETPLHSLSLELASINPDVQIRNILADIRNKTVMDQIFKDIRPQVVYHAAAYKHVPLMEENPCQAVFTNILGTKNMADLAVEYAVERFVMVSTDKAVNPSSVMGASKRIAEKYVQSLYFKNRALNGNTTKFITTRFGNVLGSNGSVVPLFKKQIEEGGPITITHPEIIRYFMTIPEACQLVLEAGAMGRGGEIFIFDMGKPVKIIDLAKKMIKLAGYIPNKDISIKIVGLRPGEKLFEELLNDAAKTLPTHHKKIMIAEEVFDNYEFVSQAVEEIINSGTDVSNEQLVWQMKQIVPEFKSLNSEFSSLDEKSVSNT
ncbi:polysaccharide biosynthesis protein [Flavobacterium sp. NST-5]|uniref:Polysaccharide biosynthesis protein n=2 Tax=Flavobacterium ichthyis TaxID=2698827 RepID=A0ABW9Z7J1_9FLAO|nr:polysaccharide biosynthesis protein [Flavobacterium ichthyis]